MVRTAERSLGRNCKAHAKPTLFATPEHLNGRCHGDDAGAMRVTPPDRGQLHFFFCCYRAPESHV
jgi:hypothetical protein